MTEPEDDRAAPDREHLPDGESESALPEHREHLPALPDPHARFGIPAFAPVLAVSMALVVVFGIARGAHAAVSTGAGALVALGDLSILTRLVHAMTNIAPE